MRRAALPLLIVALLDAGLLAVTIRPQLDLEVSRWFFTPGEGFALAKQPVFMALHELAVKGSWALGGLLGVLALAAFVRRKPVGGVAAKGWLFLFLALLLGPVLIANVALKDHWGRARPREVAEFGGGAVFSPALSPQPVRNKNGSFVSGDGSFGFFLPCFAYAAPLASRRTLSRRLFWGGMAGGAIFAFDRLAMGAHFLSDNLFAALLMLITGAALHVVMFGRRSTRDYWRAWMVLE